MEFSHHSGVFGWFSFCSERIKALSSGTRRHRPTIARHLVTGLRLDGGKNRGILFRRQGCGGHGGVRKTFVHGGGEFPRKSSVFHGADHRTDSDHGLACRIPPLLGVPPSPQAQGSRARGGKAPAEATRWRERRKWRAARGAEAGAWADTHRNEGGGPPRGPAHRDLLRSLPCSFTGAGKEDGGTSRGVSPTLDCGSELPR